MSSGRGCRSSVAGAPRPTALVGIARRHWPCGTRPTVTRPVSPWLTRPGLSLDVRPSRRRRWARASTRCSWPGRWPSRADVDLVLFGRRDDAGPVAGRWPRRRVVGARPPAPPAPAGLGAAPPARPAGRRPASTSTTDRTTPCPSARTCPTVVTVHDLSFFEEPRLARAVQGPGLPAGHRGGGPSGRGGGLPQPGDGRPAGPVVPGRGRGVRRPPRRRHRTGSGPTSPSREPTRAALARLDRRLSDGRPFLLLRGHARAPQGPARPWWPPSPGWPAGTPTPCWSWPGGTGGEWPTSSGPSSASGLADRIVRTGYVADAAVPALLRSAAAAVYPALYEGFGLPALEALACGAPLVTTSGTAMEEVAGDAAVLVGPGDGGGTGRRHRCRAGRPPRTRVRPERRRQRGFDIAAGHTWAASADRHMEAYRLAPSASSGASAPEPVWPGGDGRVTRRALPHHRWPRLRRHVAGRPSAGARATRSSSSTRRWTSPIPWPLLAAVSDAAPDAIYHLAALTHVGESWDEPLRVLEVNVIGTAAVLAAARQCGTDPAGPGHQLGRGLRGGHRPVAAPARPRTRPPPR